MSIVPFKEVNVGNPGTGTSYGPDDIRDLMELLNKKIGDPIRQIQLDGDQFKIFKWILFKQPTTAPSGVLADATELGLFVDPLDGRLKVMKFGNQKVEIENIVDDLQDLDNVIITTPVNGHLLQYNGTNWVNSAVGSVGEANTAANVGATGAGIFRDKTTTVINLRKLKSVPGSGITITQNTDDISFDFAAGTLTNIPNSSLAQITDKAKLPNDTMYATLSNIQTNDIVKWDGLKFVNAPIGIVEGEVNTITNIGVGSDVFKEKVGVNFNMRRLRTENGKVTLIQNPNDISLTVNEALFTSIPHSALNQITNKTKLPDDVIYGAVSAPQVDDVLKWNGSNWVNSPVGGGSGTSDYDDVKPTGHIFGYWFPVPGLTGDGMLAGQMVDWQPDTPQISGALDLLDTKGPNRKYSAANTDDKMGIQTTNALFTRRYNADVTFRFKIPSADLDYRLYAGFHDDTNENFTTDTEVNAHSSFMLFKASNQSTYRIVHNDGGTTQAEVDTSIAVNVNAHEVRLQADATNNRWGWSLDGSAMSFITTDIPAADTPLAFYIAMEMADSTDRDLHLYYVKMRQSNLA